MEDTQKAWLAGLTVSGKKAVLVQKRLAARDAVLARLSNDINRHARELYDGSNLTMEDDRGNTQRMLEYGRLDQTRVFDHDDQRDGYSLRSDEDLLKHLETGRLVTALSSELEVPYSEPELDDNGDPKVDPVSGDPVMREVPLFSDDELGTEFYDPLVRRGVVPETLVPDEHSSTRKMLDGSFASYKERLDEDQIKSGFRRFLSENGGLMLSGVSLVTTGVGSAATIQGAMDVKPDDVGTSGLFSSSGGLLDDNGKADMGGVNSAVSFGWDLITDKIPSAVGDLGGSSQTRASRTAACERTATNLVAACANAVGDALKTWKLDISVASVFTSKARPVALAVTLSTEGFDTSHVPALVDPLKAAVVQAFQAADPGVSGSGAIVRCAAEACAGAFGARVDAGKVAGWMGDEPDLNAVLKHVHEAMKEGMKEVPHQTAFTDLLTAHGAAAAQKLGDAMKQVIEDDLKEDEDEDALALTRIQEEEDGRRSAGLLEKRIAKMERDRKLLDWSANIAGMGFDVAAAFFAPMAIAGSLLKFSLQIAKAAKRTMDFLVWLDKRTDMLTAASPFSSAVARFVQSASKQAAHYSAQAAVELCNMIGAIIETVGMCTGPGAAIAVAVGKAIQAGAAIAGAIENVLYEISKRVDLEKAWKSYRLAMLRPENRKLGLKAVKANPTLAKYAVAWGCVIKKDLLVNDFLSSTGLNAETLRDDKTDVTMMVRYLEVRMADDIVVTGRTVPSTDWEPAEITLTARSWVSAVSVARAKAGLLPSDTTRIEGALVRWEGTLKAARAAFQPREDPPQYVSPELAAEGKRDLETVRTALLTFEAWREERGERTKHHDMVRVRGRYLDLTTSAGEQLESMLAP